MDSYENIDQIIDTYKDLVYRVCVIHIKNRYDADDVFQNVFLALVKKRIVFENETHCKAWLIRTAINLCKKQMHDNKRELSKREKMISEQSCSANESDLIFEKISVLSEKYKTVIQLFYYEELSCYEIADLLRINYATVRKRLSRGREQLKKLLPEDILN